MSAGIDYGLSASMTLAEALTDLLDAIERFADALEVPA